MVTPRYANVVTQSQTTKAASTSTKACVAVGEPLPVVPLPRQITRSPGSFMLPSAVTIGADAGAARDVATLLAAQLRQLGLAAVARDMDPRASIRLTLDARAAGLGSEGYRLTVDDSGVAVIAGTGAGLFYGAQTLEQILSRDGRTTCQIPYVRVVDWPEYSWRGVHLDVSRHFFPVPVVEQYIDLAARFKLNRFHWHLTDDQGWRIEIRAYPRLTSVGGCRGGTQVGGYDSGTTDGLRTCGFYTQDQIREVVAYAAARYVSVIPEIEGPGHSVEVLAAYPFLACEPGPFATMVFWGSTKYSVCPTVQTFDFYDGVIREVAQLFPSRLIHIGGDEVPHFSWRQSAFVDELMRKEGLHTYSEVQGYFTRRIESIARKYGRRIVGWNEIESAGVSRDAIVMAWSGENAGLVAAEHGNDVVMTPDPSLYFDAYQGNPRYEPAAIGGLGATPTTLERVYAYDPAPQTLSTEERAHILGAQGNLWTEYVPTDSHLLYMAYPKVLALAELCWTPRALMRWADFTRRLGPNLARFEALGIPFRIPEVRFRLEPSSALLSSEQTAEEGVVISAGQAHAIIALTALVPDATIHYTLNGTVPTPSSAVYRNALRLSLKQGVTRIAAIAVLVDRRFSAPSFLSLSR